jgi:hypothetical protein
VINLRRRPWFGEMTTPPLDTEYIGNVLSHIIATATRRQLIEGDLSQVIDFPYHPSIV